MIAAITLAGVMAAAKPAPTLPPLSSITVSAGPRVPSFTQPPHVPHDFRTLSAISSFDSGRIPLADALASMAPQPQTATASFGISVRIVQPSTSCNTKPAMWYAIGAQVADAFVTANARRAGSLPASSFASSPSFASNLAQYGIGDFLTFSLTRHAPCAVRNIGAFGLGAAAQNNMEQTGWPK